ncbi:MAG: lamin tail domain-containing protein [Pirellulales bacterium]
MHRSARSARRASPPFEALEPRCLLAAQFVINEFLAANGNNLVDGFGERSDWIEIRNVGDAPGDLAGHHLTDSAGDLDKWTFPANTIVPASGYLVVFASGRDTTDAQGRRHTNFSLDIDAEYVALVSPTNVVLSEFGANGGDYPPQRPNISYGLNGTSTLYMLPTPGSNNGGGFSELVGDTRFSVDRGFYDAPFQLVISTNTPGAEIRFTTNGTVPSTSSGTLYTGPITINRTTTVRAIAYKPGAIPSNVDTQTYIFLNDVVAQSFQSTIAAGFPSTWGSTAPDYGMDPDVLGPNDLFGGIYAASIRDDLRAIPTVSIVMNVNDMFGPSGIYSNPTQSGAAWERATSIEYILPDGSDAFQIDAGIQIQGGAFRRHDLTKKKSFRVNFKEQYGAAKLEYPLFGENATDEFDNFILRAENNDGWQWSSAGSRPLYSRDEWAARTQLEMGQPAVHGHHVHVYINGVYWGMYNLVERPDDAFAAAYMGGEKEEWDAINSGEAVAGSTAAWNTMISLATAVRNAPDDATRVAAWQRLQGNNPDGSDNPAFEDYLDVDSLIDYMIVNIYAGNNDWPSHNYYVGRRRGPESTGFKFFSWDAEWILGLNSDLNANRTGVNINVAQPYDLLKSVPEFQIQFADRVQKHFFNGGVLYVDPNNPNWDPAHPERNRPAARFVELSSEITDAIVGESARWGDQHHAVPHTRNADWEVERNRILTSYFPQRSAIVLSQLRAAGLYPNVDAPTFNQHGGQVPVGFDLRMNASAGTIYYTLDGSDPRLENGAINLDAIEYPAVNITNTLIPRGSTWKYLDNGSNQGTAWRATTFSDASWASGPAPLGFGDGDEARIINGGPSGNRFMTTYFRRTFQVTNPAEITTLKVRVVRDDGAVVYINGQEVGRSNMPSGTISSSTPAAGVVGGADESTFYELNIDPALLAAGTNVIAVELHQSGPTSTDLSFDLELVAYTSTGAPPIVINGPTTVRARTRDAPNWSALNEADFTIHAPASAANLKISELNYNPYDAVPANGEPNVSNNEFEYIELQNTTSATIDLGGVRFTTGISFNFTGSNATVLGPGEHVVVVKNSSAFQSRYTTDRIAGVYVGSLDNSGERIVLTAADGSVIDDFTYDDGGAWPGRADGGGSTLERRTVSGDPNDEATWRSSVELGGTPAAAGAGSVNSILVNEVLTHTDPPLADAIELHNPTNAPIDIGGWYLSDGNQPAGVSDGLTQYQRFRIPNGTILQPGAYVVFDESQFGQGSLGFGLNSAEGDDVYLLQADPTTGKLLNFIEHVEFAAAANGESFGRWPNGEGSLYPMQSRTLGAANSGPRIGPVIISELMYNPQSGNDDLEYVELTNITDAPIDLTDWKFDAGFDFTFGATMLPARGTLVVLRFDPANAGNAAKLNAFRAAYPGLPQNAQLVGGYAGVLDGGVLDNGGETVRLVRPDTPQPGGLIPYTLIDEVDYNDNAPWPTSPDGAGAALTRASQTIYGKEPTNWTGETGSPGIADLSQPLTTITGTEGNDTYYVVRSGAQLHVYENTPPIGQPTYSSELSALGPSLTINTLGGDDSMFVDSGGQGALGLGQLIYHAGAGANSLTLSSGSARIDSTATGGTLNTTVQAGAQLSTNRLSQNGLTLAAATRVTLLPDGQTSVITSLALGAGATLDIGNNALVLDYTGTSPVTTVREKILAGRGGPGLGASWNGAGITSSAVAQANLAEPESRSIGYAENAALPLGAYNNFRGVTLDGTAVLIAYTRTGDANLDGFVNDDDATVLGASYAPTTANAVWALGDFEYNGFVDDDDATLLGVYPGLPAGAAAVPSFPSSALPSFRSSAWERTAAKLRFADAPTDVESRTLPLVTNVENNHTDDEDDPVEIIARSVAETTASLSDDLSRRAAKPARPGAGRHLPRIVPR